MFNQIQLLGYLGADPDVVTSRGGKTYLHLSVATSSWNGKDQIKETDWHRVRVIFPSQVKYLRDRAKKGDVVHIVGRMTSYSFTPNESTQRVTVAFVLAQEVHLIAPRREAETNHQPNDVDENDIPF